MDRIALLLKSYAGDLVYARRLMQSVSRYNADELPLHVVVPGADITAFSEFTSSKVHLHAEEDVSGSHLVREPIGEVRVGYANQEIVKLSFWETGLCANYFCIDSDAIFLRDFTAEDFMHDEGTPYTVLVEDKDLKVDPRYYREHWTGREQSIERIAEVIGFEEPVLKTCHGHQIMSREVLRSMRDHLLEPRGWDYRDLLSISPYEFSWYAIWLQHTQPIAIHQREPLVKVFHNYDQYLAATLSGVTEADIARAYLAVVVNSNFSRELGPLRVQDSKADALATQLSYGETGRLLRAKLRDTAKRRLPHVWKS